MIPRRYQKLARELLAFGMAGAINTILGTVIFNVLLSRGWLVATTISTAIATVSSYLMNRHVTYRHRPRTSLRRELPMFVTFNLLALFLRLGIMAAAKATFALENSDRLELNIVNAVGIVVGTVFLLLTYRTFVFKKEPVTTPIAEPARATVPAIVIQTTVPAIVAQAAAPAAEANSDGFAELTNDLEAELSAEAIIDEMLVTDTTQDKAVRSAL